MDLDQAREFAAEHHRAVLVTHRSDGRLQTSPIMTTPDGQGRLMISSRETAFKVKNIERDPRVTLCVFTEAFFGDWVHVEGRASVVTLPDAMDLLVDYYRRVAGEHPDWDDYRAAMERERRVMVLVDLEHAGPDASG